MTTSNNNVALKLLGRILAVCGTTATIALSVSLSMLVYQNFDNNSDKENQQTQQTQQENDDNLVGALSTEIKDYNTSVNLDGYKEISRLTKIYRDAMNTNCSSITNSTNKMNCYNDLSRQHLNAVEKLVKCRLGEIKCEIDELGKIKN